jgi:hypothetical protein
MVKLQSFDTPIVTAYRAATALIFNSLPAQFPTPFLDGPY